MNVDEMPAGPELDRLIAEKVMGCMVEKYLNRDQWHLIIPNGVNQTGFVFSDDPWSACPKYSTSILEAWTVVEKIHTTTPLRIVLFVDEDGVMVAAWSFNGIQEYGPKYIDCRYDFPTKADTFPLAICRSVLKAKKINLE